jgi:hypothetical protein
MPVFASIAGDTANVHTLALDDELLAKAQTFTRLRQKIKGTKSLIEHERTKRLALLGTEPGPRR